VAEAAARSALQKRAVDAAEPFPHFTAAEKELRIRLRARGRQAGDGRDDTRKTQSIDQIDAENLTGTKKQTSRGRKPNDGARVETLK